MEERVLLELKRMEKGENYRELADLAGQICNEIFEIRKKALLGEEEDESSSTEDLMALFREKLEEIGISCDLDDTSLYDVIQRFNMYLIIKNA